jgi:hypothetical protein
MDHVPGTIPPLHRRAGPGQERGRGMAIVTALAGDSGVRPEPVGKTTWFTLALSGRTSRAVRQAEPAPNSRPGPDPKGAPEMTEPDNTSIAEQRAFQARETARRAAFRLARDAGAAIVTRPMYRSAAEPAVRDIEPLAGARAARDLELAASGTVRDYIRQAREAGHGWDQIGQALGQNPGRDARQEGATVADAAYTYAAGRPETEAPWRPRSFGWTCRSCDQQITDRGLIQGPTDDELGHADGCRRLAADIAAWDAEAARWDAEWEAGQ